MYVYVSGVVVVSIYDIRVAVRVVRVDVVVVVVIVVSIVYVCVGTALANVTCCCV